MSKKRATARVSEDLYEAIEERRAEERLDRSTAVARFLDILEDRRVEANYTGRPQGRPGCSP